ncbi:hypothetical protein [Streptomyces sp. SID13031]|uniref:hypothetical protein n=1 Tax=Streptomyces sp. SID13031 TaxID=2706046 RepID=UPI0013CC95D1|nr:hypothetical protein [Streptomyces sp. SID13031]NEA32144.1 hypothetical protein [Streptomyces sp. SID13031]
MCAIDIAELRAKGDYSTIDQSSDVGPPTRPNHDLDLVCGFTRQPDPQGFRHFYAGAVAHDRLGPSSSLVAPGEHTNLGRAFPVGNQHRQTSRQHIKVDEMFHAYILPYPARPTSSRTKTVKLRATVGTSSGARWMPLGQPDGIDIAAELL